MHKCELRDLGRMPYAEAFTLQRDLVEQRKAGTIPDQLLIVEHPHVITVGRNGKLEHLLADEAKLARSGIALERTDRGGDVTYHGPGQVVGYPVMDLKQWKRDVVAYVRALEQTIIDAVAEFGIRAGRETGMTGVWVDGRKIAAIGVHVSRWVTSHGFALNHNTDLAYFQYIVPCGLTKPVTSMEAEGVETGRAQVIEALARGFGRAFDREVTPLEVYEETLS